MCCYSSMVQVSPDWSALIAHAEERKWVVEVTPHMSAAIAAQRIKLPRSTVHTVQGSSVTLASQHHRGTSKNNTCSKGERQTRDSSHTRQEAQVDEVTPKSSGSQLPHYTSAPDVTARDVRKRGNATDGASEAKRVKPAVSDSHVPQVQSGNATTTGRGDTRQLDCNHSTVQSETKTTPLLPPRSQPGLLPTPPIGIKPGNLSNLGFNPGPKRRMAHTQTSAPWRSSHVPSIHNRCPHHERPNRNAVGQQRMRKWKSSRHK